MRIRKNAKISPLIYAASSLKPGTVLQTHICQLNQSPWDVMSFSPPSTPLPPLPPPSLQVNGNDGFARNGSLGESIAAFESAASMKVAEDHEVTKEIKDAKLDYSDCIAAGSASDKAEEGAVSSMLKKDNESVYCCKTDGKGWKCKREAADGNSMCEHHLSLVRNYNNLASPTAKKPADSRRRPRAKKAASTSLATNPYEFYYYSGFGPRWGKKRGENNRSNRSRDEPEQENEMAQSTLSQLDNDESEIEDEVEYEENGEGGRKRARKPIKARSLKSLM
ncbi:wrc domain-containing protein [Abeliophyllum distichum]|uniref:Wrc domain-containing protein n=1 Tax=Abeliophyllum distichum TaxID=126358 RepID=A0ABD1Q2W6_9LAMI